MKDFCCFGRAKNGATKRSRRKEVVGMEGEEFQFSHGQNIRTLKYVPRTKALGTQTDDGLAIVLTYVILLRTK